MRTENNAKLFADKEITNFGTRSYYFHPDEDFREDWDWGKSTETDSSESDVIIGL